MSFTLSTVGEYPLFYWCKMKIVFDLDEVLDLVHDSSAVRNIAEEQGWKNWKALIELDADDYTRVIGVSVLKNCEPKK